MVRAGVIKFLSIPQTDRGISPEIVTEKLENVVNLPITSISLSPGQNFAVGLKKNQNAPRPSEHPPVRGGGMSKRLGETKGCKYIVLVAHVDLFE